MTLTEYTSAGEFLATVEEALLQQEPLYGLTLGICRVLTRNPLRYGSRPFLAAVTKDQSLEVAAIMTPPYKLQLCAGDGCDPNALRVLAHALSDGGWPVPAVLATQPLAENFAAIWCKVATTTSNICMRQRIHELRSVIAPPSPPGTMVQATEADLSIATQWFNAFHDEVLHEGEPRLPEAAKNAIREGRLFVWDDEGPCSMAARTRPTVNGESIGAVYTPPDRRRRGYASALVAGLSQRILDSGKSFCTLFTDLSNATSNHIYREIGYLPVADVVDIHFHHGMPG